MSAEELKQVALEVVAEGKDIVLNLDGVDHLDASLLQILLALNAEQTKQGCNLRLLNASQLLQRRAASFLPQRNSNEFMCEEPDERSGAWLALQRDCGR